MKQLDDLSLSRRDRAAIREATTILRDLLPVDEVILFGSKSRGDDDPESDIDLLVLTTRALSHAERNAMTDSLFGVELTHDVVLSVLAVPSEEWRCGSISVLPIHAEIEEQGAVA